MNATPSDRAGGHPAKRSVKGFLTALRRDAAGNTLAMMGAFTIPLAALAGSAVDMSRLYLVKARLQQACDAGVLAGRKVMTVTSGTTLDAAAYNASNPSASPAYNAAKQFFDNNFPSGWMSTTNVSFTPSRTSDSQVTATASATVPMAIMGMFGFGATPQTTTCTARLDIGDSDIMFVLDVTGSMGCSSGSGCSSTSTWTRADGSTGYYIVEQSGSKISSLRSAVKLFRTTLEANKPVAAHIRYGFVPYSSAVNVGKLITDNSVAASGKPVNPGNPAYIVNSTSYPSRELADDINSSTLPTDTNTSNYDVTTSSTPGKYYEGDMIYGSTSSTPTAAQITTVTLPNTAPDGTAAAKDKAGCLKQEVRVVGTTKYAKGTYPTSGALTRKFPVWTPTGTVCKLYAWTVKPYWRYTNVVQDVSTFKTFASVTDPTKITGATTKWSGCIEERDTTASSTSTTYSSTSLPKDMDPDYVPNSDATRWRPLWPDVIYYRAGTAATLDSNGSGSTATSSDTTATGAGTALTPLLQSATGGSLGPTTQYYGCSAPAKRLDEYTSTDFDNYLGTATTGDFRPFGHTYHDVGMIWGLRLLSPDGIWKADTAAWPGNNPPNRYIVFMTDGLMDPDPLSYYGYGLNKFEAGAAPVGTSDTNLATIHAKRFQAVCQAAKDKNITVFVVEFDVGSTPSQPMIDCATPDFAYAAQTSAQLQTAFSTIALQIARLRLSQ